jgi:hypothetical protein
MSRLARQQEALLQALWHPVAAQALAPLESHVVFGDATLRGLRAYRSNGRALAQRALGAAYPTVAGILGAQDFAGLARQHWTRCPPARGDIAHWGEALPEHIESIGELVADQPQLADFARVDWAVHRAAFAADAPADVASLNLLVERDPAHLTLRLAPATSCVAHAVVWREGLAPRMRSAARGEARFIAALQERRSLPDALAAAPGIDFAEWLAAAVQAGLVLGAELL